MKELLLAVLVLGTAQGQRTECGTRKSVYDFNITTLDGLTTTSLKEHEGKVLLIINSASL